ncbi:hypothetical protein AB0L44_06980 [Nonomuraea wenchangensis]|uniref:hypothetical protein n=1 Tax=Nonomuraea wenchangensis TaxID=568860 RepID=UPI0034425F9A
MVIFNELMTRIAGRFGRNTSPTTRPPLTLAVALWRTRLAPWWAAVTLVVALAADFTAPDAMSGIMMFALMGVALAPLAARLFALEPTAESCVATRA